MKRCLNTFVYGCLFALLFAPEFSLAETISQPREGADREADRSAEERGDSLTPKPPVHLAKSVLPTRFAGDPTSARTTLSPATPQASQGAPAKFSVHEWGLVIYSQNSAEISTSGHDRHPKIEIFLDMDKPLLYLHPEAGFDFDTSISVSVTIQGEGNRIREVWPTPWAEPQPFHTEKFTWPNIKIIKNQRCGKELAPTLESLACTSLDDGGVCEAHEMSLYLGEVPHCLKSVEDGILTPVLLYNALLTAKKTPLSIAIHPQRPEESKIENISKHSLGITYIRVGKKLWRIKSLDVGSIIKVGEGEYLGHIKDNIQTRIHADLRSQGLTDQEAEDFINAWSPNILKTPYEWKAFGFFGAAGIESLSTLDVSPKPLNIKRVMGFAIR